MVSRIFIIYPLSTQKCLYAQIEGLILRKSTNFCDPRKYTIEIHFGNCNTGKSLSTTQKAFNMIVPTDFLKEI